MILKELKRLLRRCKTRENNAPFFIYINTHHILEQQTHISSFYDPHRASLKSNHSYA